MGRFKKLFEEAKGVLITSTFISEDFKIGSIMSQNSRPVREPLYLSGANTIFIDSNFNLILMVKNNLRLI